MQILFLNQHKKKSEHAIRQIFILQVKTGGPLIHSIKKELPTIDYFHMNSFKFAQQSVAL